MKHFDHYRIMLLGVLFALCSQGALAQDTLNTPKSLEEKYDAYARILSPEKVYLHSDKDVYAIGDTIWFKGYVANASSVSEYPESRFIYVELIGNVYSTPSRVKCPLAIRLAYLPGHFPAHGPSPK